MKKATSVAEVEVHEATEDMEPGFFYGDMPPIRDLSDAVVGLPPREAVKILRARRSEQMGKQAY